MPFSHGFNLFNLQRDLLWAGAELTAKLFNDPLLSLMARKGDGKRPVMTLPGFSGTESTLDFLNTFLQQSGYVANAWGIGTNTGLRDMAQLDRVATKLVDRVRGLADKHEQPVALVGQSLGGIFARELARRIPDDIERIITLGTPTIMSEMPLSMNEAAAHILMSFTGHRSNTKGFDLSEPPPGVTLVSIYSPYDGIVSPEAAKIPDIYLNATDGPIRENVELFCSHYGMAMNPLVLLAISDRLAQDKQEWVPFDPLGYAGIR